MEIPKFVPSPKDREQIGNLQVKALLGIVVMVIITIFSASFLRSYSTIIHTVLEITCIFYAISAFGQVWYTHDRATTIHHTIGFGFLVVAFFNILHTFYYKGLGFYPTGYSDLNLRYCFLGNLTLAIILILITCNNFKIRLNKWIGLTIAILAPAIVSYMIFRFPKVLPNLNSNGHVNFWRIFLECLIILLYIVALFRLKKLGPIHSVTRKYVFLAILLAIPSEITMYFIGGISSLNILPHLLRLLSYYFLFKGTYVSAIIYPYEKLENILDSLDTGLVNSDDNLYVTYINKKMETLLAFKKHDAIGKPVLEWSKKFRKDPTQKLFIEDVLEKGRPSVGNLQDIYNLHGEKIKVRTDVQKLVSGGYVTLFYDAKKEQELENLQIQTQTILDSIQNFVFIIDKNRKIILCNQAFSNLVGVSVKAIVGMDLDILNKMIHFSEDKKVEKRSQGENITTTTSVKIIDINGVAKELIINNGPIVNFDGEIIGEIGTGVEVTDYKLEQERLKQQEKLAVLGQMAAGIVHEIRNPLTTLKGFAQLINNKSANDVVKEYACTMENEVDNINHIVSDFLTFAKPQFPVLKEVSLNSLLQSLSLMMETKSFIEEVDIQLTLTPDEKMVLADEFKLRQVILNVLKNGIEAMNEVKNRRLKIRTTIDEGKSEMLLTITDNGKGMSQEDLTKVGTPFYSTKNQGTGLGLSICYQIIKEHGGHIKIKSELGKGTSFIISLPCVK